MFKLYEFVRITVTKNADHQMLKLVAEVANKYKR